MMNNFYFRTKLFLPSWPKNLPHKRALSVWDCLALVTEYPQIFRMMRVILLVCTCLVNTGLYRKILVAVQSLILLMQFIFYESFWFEKLPSSHLVMNNAFHRGTDFKHLKVAAVSLLMKLQFFSSDQITVQALYTQSVLDKSIDLLLESPSREKKVPMTLIEKRLEIRLLFLRPRTKIIFLVKWKSKLAYSY